MNGLERHIARYFRNISQAFFFDNAWFGAAFLGLFFTFGRHSFIHGLTASLIGYAYSARRRTPTFLKETGLITLNGLFFGLAMSGLFESSPQFYLVFMLGAMTIPMVTKAMHEVFQHWKMSPYIMPYIWVAWVICLCAREGSFGFTPRSMFFAALSMPHMPPACAQSLNSLFLSMGRLLFLPDPRFGLAILALVTLFSPRRGLYFLFGSGVAIATLALLSGTSELWRSGEFSYSAGLVGLGLASFPEKFKWRTILLFCAVSAILTLALRPLLAGLNLPLLSLPYVLTFWLALLSRIPRVNMSWAPSRVSVPLRAIQKPENAA